MQVHTHTWIEFILLLTISNMPVTFLLCPVIVTQMYNVINQLLYLLSEESYRGR